MDETAFAAIQEKAAHFAFSALNHVDFEDCMNADIIRDTDSLLLLLDQSKTPAMLYFSADDFGNVINAVSSLPGALRIHFVPREYAAQLSSLGFAEWCEWADYWNPAIADTASRFVELPPFDFLRAEEYSVAATLSQACRLQSRGFEGETAEWFAEWAAENAILACREGAVLAGFCCVSIYNKGTTLWVREIAVDPVRQGKGIGKTLMAQAIQYGVTHGAVKAFLAADVLNKNAIALYEKCGFRANGGESELQMVREASV